jgi:hypothetical protein
MSSPLPIQHQLGALKSYFPAGRTTQLGRDRLTWVQTITPTPLSDTYTIKLHYVIGQQPKVFVAKPTLTFALGQTKLKHVYSTKRQELCVYYPKWREWRPDMYFVHTLIPWTSEWLYHHEIWVGTGVWTGGGIEHDVDEDTKTTNNGI